MARKKNTKLSEITIQRMKDRSKTPETIAKRKAAQQRIGKDPKIRQQRRENALKQWKDPEFYAAHTGENHPAYDKEVSQETRDKISISGTGREVTEEQRINYSNSKKGDKNPAWNGGTSFLPYDEKFNEEFKDYIRSRQNNICADAHVSPCSNSVISRKLDVHHIDRNKQNTCNTNCIALCVSHHSKAHNKKARIRHFEFVKNLIENNKD